MPRRVLSSLVLLMALAAACASGGQASWLGIARTIAPGVDLFQVNDPSLGSPAGPMAVYLLRLDPDKVAVDSALSNDAVIDAERVDDIARRRQAIAAVNAGFFNVKNGEPAGLLKVGGVLVSDTSLTRGVVAIHSPAGARQQFFFDQASVKMSAQAATGDDKFPLAIDGVDTTRERGKLMLYTPSYHVHTDTAANGVEWVFTGNPLTVKEIRRDLGRTAIPRDGLVLSYGGLEPPSPLDRLVTGSTLTLQPVWKILNGTPEDRLRDARDIINGAGLLKRNGQTLSGWLASENLQPKTFTDVRHPRTLIGTDRRGHVWLVVVDGRQPDYSVGMTFEELLGLANRLELDNALNLDGGGSTTMVVNGAIVNRPSDASGPRPVSDAIIVRAR